MISYSHLAVASSIAMLAWVSITSGSTNAFGQTEASMVIDSVNLNSDGSISVTLSVFCSESGNSDGVGMNVRQPTTLHHRANGGDSTSTYECDETGTSLTLTAFPSEGESEYGPGRTELQIFTGIFFPDSGAFLSLTTDQSFACNPRTCVPITQAQTTIVEI